MAPSWISTDLASASCAVLIWSRLVDAGVVPEHPLVNEDRARDILAVCREHGLYPEHGVVIDVFTRMVIDVHSEMEIDPIQAKQWTIDALAGLSQDGMGEKP